MDEEFLKHHGALMAERDELAHRVHDLEYALTQIRRMGWMAADDDHERIVRMTRWADDALMGKVWNDAEHTG